MREGWVASVCDTAWGYLEAGNEVREIEGCTFVVGTRWPRRWDANLVTRVRCDAPGGVERLFENVERVHGHLGHRRIAVDPLTPPAVVARLAFESVPHEETLWMGLDGALSGTPPTVDVRLARTDADWEAMAVLVAAEWRESEAKQGRTADLDLVAEFVASKRAKSPPIRHWLAFRDGVACGYFSSWEGRDGLGIVEDLFTLPTHRHRGVATALLHHCVADARAHGAGLVIIGTLSNDTPKRMYAALGFRPLLTTRHYTWLV